MTYAILMICILLTFANIAAAMVVAWLLAELLPDVIEKIRKIRG